MNVSTGAHLHALTGLADNVNSISFRPDGQTLASGSEAGTVLLWDLSSLLPQEPIVQVDASKRPPMYWIDTETGTLHRLVGAKVVNLLPNVQNATSLAVDTIHGKIYWTEKTGERTGKIHTVNLDGSNARLVKDLKSVPLTSLLTL